MTNETRAMAPHRLQDDQEEHRDEKAVRTTAACMLPAALSSDPEMRSILVSIALLALVGGCSTRPPLKPFEFAPTESKARIKFYDDANRISATLSVSEKCGEEGKAPTWRWVEIPAGVRVYVEHRNDTGYAGSTCGYYYSFVPKAGASYISDLKEKVFYCTYELYEQPIENGEKIEIPTKRRESCRR